MKELREPESRAVQFFAFESLRGYSEMIEESQFVPDERIDLTEEELEKLSVKLSKLRKGMRVTVTYYLKNQYTLFTDTVSAVDEIEHFLKVGKIKILFSDLLKIKMEGD